MTTTPAIVRATERNWWLGTGVAFAALVVVFGAFSAASWLARHTETQHQTYDHPISRLVIDTGTGNLTLTRGKEASVAVDRRLTWSFWKPEISETWDGDTLRVSTRCPLLSIGPGCGVDFAIQLPESVAVEAHAGTGDVTVRNLRGDLRLSTGTGDIDVTNASGRLAMESGTGAIAAYGLSSSEVNAGTGTGDVALRFTQSPSDVRADAGTGDISVTVPSGETYHVDATTGTGDVRVQLAQDPDASRRMVMHTGTGDIEAAYV